MKTKGKRGENMIKAYAKSDIGKVREINQDYYYISNSLDEVQLYMLADGMGGYKGGEIASSLAVQSAKSYIENNFKEIPKDKDSIIQLVGSSMEYANMVVYEKSKEDPELEGMGTTLEVCAKISKGWNYYTRTSSTSSSKKYVNEGFRLQCFCRTRCYGKRILKR